MYMMIMFDLKLRFLTVRKFFVSYKTTQKAQPPIPLVLSTRSERSSMTEIRKQSSRSRVVLTLKEESNHSSSWLQ